MSRHSASLSYKGEWASRWIYVLASSYIHNYEYYKTTARFLLTVSALAFLLVYSYMKNFAMLCKYIHFKMV